MHRNWNNQKPIPAFKTKREIAKITKEQNTMIKNNNKTQRNKNKNERLSPQRWPAIQQPETKLNVYEQI